MADVDHLRIRLLGGLSVDGLDERDLGSRKGRTLLKLLAAARGAPLSPDRIADALWGDALPARPVDQVGVLVSRLRGVLGAARVPRTDAGYALLVDWLDVDELAERVTEAERRHAAGQSTAARAAAGAALSLCRGPLLPEEDGQWASTERSAAESMARRARAVLADAAIAAGDHGAGLAAAEETLAADPLDEAALRALMRAHVLAGRPASALAAYVQMKELLAEELGIPPSSETEALHDAVVLGDIVAGAPPPEVAPLPGRGVELAAIDEAIRSATGGTNELVLVVGEAGIGKTALVAAAALGAAARGCTVVRCRASALAHDLPLQPVIDGLATGLRAVSPSAAEAIIGRDVALLGLLGLRAVVEPGAATVVPEAAAERIRLFGSLLAALERLAGPSALVLTVDDLHRADAATVLWLDFACRRSARMAVLATARARSGGARPGGLQPTRTLELGPVDVAAAAEIVGPERAIALHERSGGNPLFLVELARSMDTVPASVRDAVLDRVDGLGEGPARTLRTAAVLGMEADLDVLAGVVDSTVAELLDHADAAAAEGVLRERGTGYVFAHELVRDALAAGVSARRRAFLHQRAASVLAARPGADPHAVAWHAEQGGDHVLAADALRRVAAHAAVRFDHDEAERALTRAITLADGPTVRIARAQVRMARWDLEGAALDAGSARAQGGGPAAFETAGWVAYYGRDYDAAQRFADEGAERSTDDAVRASCLALGGRTRHAQGDLVGAEPRLAEAATCRTTEVRSVALVWLGGLRAHQGDAEVALDLAERALFEPDRFAHPFGRFHGRFYQALAAGMLGRAAAVDAAADELEAHARAAGPQGARFLAIVLNLRAWTRRAAGRTGEAVDLLEEAIDRCDPDAPSVAEPRRVAQLDLVEALLDAGRIDDAKPRLDRATAEIGDWAGTMAWRARQRLRLLEARCLLLGGDSAAAHAGALALAADASATGNGRHALLARCLAAEAAGEAGGRVDLEAVALDLRALETSAGLEAWRVTARLAAACDVEAWWRIAEQRAASFAASSGAEAAAVEEHVSRALEGIRRRR